jgi:hypothetical protein
MDPVSPTRSPKNLGRDQYPGTPPSFRAWDVHTPTTTSSHKRSRLRDTWRSLRSNGKSHRADESSSPRTAQRKKFGWEILATIRSRKPKDANNYQDAATTARPNTTSPSKKNTEHCKIWISSTIMNSLTSNSRISS